MDREELARRLRTTFLVELEEHVRTLNRDLLALEQDPRDGGRAELESLYRTVHSLKGAARAVDAPMIEAACHRLEAILAATRDGEQALDHPLIQLLFRVTDALEEAGTQLREGAHLGASPLHDLLSQLEALAPVAGSAAPPTPPPPGRTTAAITEETFVRVQVEKLDNLVRSSGQLLVARRRLATRQDELASLLEAVRSVSFVSQPKRAPARALAAQPMELARQGAVQRRRRHQPTGGGEADSAAARNELEQLERGLERLLDASRADQRRLEQAAGRLEEEVLSLRMAPFFQACEGLERMVRDLASSTGRDVDLAVEDGQVELDRAILAQLRDPLVHLVRNAVAHGIEPPAEREALGKPRRGRVVVAAGMKGGSVHITVTDDGRGIALDAVRSHAERRGLPLVDDEEELARMVFLPGFSTAANVTDIAGRGVGLDVVSHRAQALHGSVDLSFQRGRGTTFSLTVPLTLSTIRALLVRCGDHVFALPSTNIRRLLRPGPAEVLSLGGYDAVRGDGAPVRVVRLGDILGIPIPTSPWGNVPVVVAAVGERQAAFVVDELLGDQDVVVKSLGPRFRRVRNVAGATILPTGRVALILSAADLVNAAADPAAPRPVFEAPAKEVPRRPKRVLVVDDSVTTRTLERTILEAAGYDVRVAVDGADAWAVLQDERPDVVVTDVEMPRMDGFSLTQAIRGSERLRDIAVVLVTGRDSDPDRLRGLEAGADAYLPKSTLDQAALLRTIADLL